MPATHDHPTPRDARPPAVELSACPLGSCLIGHHRGRGDAVHIDGVWWHVTASDGVQQSVGPVTDTSALHDPDLTAQEADAFLDALDDGPDQPPDS